MSLAGTLSQRPRLPPSPLSHGAQAWPGSEKRATLIQLVDKWRKVMPNTCQDGSHAECCTLLPAHPGRPLQWQLEDAACIPPQQSSWRAPAGWLTRCISMCLQESAAAKALSRDENEAVVQQLTADGHLKLDFGFSACERSAAAGILAFRPAVYRAACLGLPSPPACLPAILLC